MNETKKNLEKQKKNIKKKKKIFYNKKKKKNFFIQSRNYNQNRNTNACSGLHKYH